MRQGRFYAVSVQVALRLILSDTDAVAAVPFHRTALADLAALRSLFTQDTLSGREILPGGAINGLDTLDLGTDRAIEDSLRDAELAVEELNGVGDGFLDGADGECRCDGDAGEHGIGGMSCGEIATVKKCCQVPTGLPQRLKAASPQRPRHGAASP